MRFIKPCLVLLVAAGLASCSFTGPAGSQVSCQRLLFGAGSGPRDIYSICPDGSGLMRLIPGGDMPAWSPDGTRIAFISTRGGAADVYVAQADGSAVAQVTHDDLADSLPVWLPDGAHLAVRSTDPGGLWWWRTVKLDGSESTDITEHLYDYFFQTPAWSPDGGWMAYMSLVEQQERNDGSSQIHLRSSDGRSDLALTNDTWANINPAWSRDGKRIAFLSEMDGAYNRYSLYVIATDGENLRRVIGNDHFLDEDTRLSWAPDGWSIAYNSAFTRIGVADLALGGDKQIFDAAVELGQGNTVSAPAWQP